jgi:hypothetical protein
MNVTLWVFQVLLALHTLMGAIWKFSNSEQAVPSLKALPHGAWMALSVVEILCAAGLVLPFAVSSLGMAAPAAAVVIAAEMLLFCVLHLASRTPVNGQVAYWLVVALFCAFVAYGRLALKPL